MKNLMAECRAISKHCFTNWKITPDKQKKFDQDYRGYRAEGDWARIKNKTGKGGRDGKA